MTRIDTKALTESINLVDIIEVDLGRPGKKSGKWTLFPCPFHDDRDPSMGVTKDGYHCFGCGASGDAIKWKIEFGKLSFLDACHALDPAAQKIEFSTQVENRTWTPAEKHLPVDQQTAWREIIDVCQDQLWSDTGKAARQYLYDRGLKDDTLRSPFFRVGFSTGKKIADVWVDKGIVLPCFTVKQDMDIDFISYIKIRRGKSWLYKPEDQSKYRKLPGHGADTSGLYGAEFIKGADVVFVTEGEFDCLLLHQEAGDLVGVCTLGSASEQFDWSRWGRYVGFAQWFFVTYDDDAAGHKGAKNWEQMTGRVIKPMLPEGPGKDITDAWKAGVRLDQWVLDTLAENNIE